ncbi:MAG TPA: lysophospholipid acyltransferase family protein [Streptosporangiaceae bacterium]|nr:lysophospholipid acyltransferase family protein [Streptosporangiaceae bacterium]
MSRRADRGYSPAVRRATTTILPPLIKAIMKRDWHGHEHIPRAGGVILAPNHLSYADWAAVALFTHEAGRYPAFLIKSPVFDVKVVGPFLHACGQLPVHREQAGAALVLKELKEAENRLRAGECLIVYPEGTASRDPGLWPMVAKTGVARLALVTGAPVIPVAHWGAQVILPYGSKKPDLFPRHLVKMLAGPAVDLSAYAGKPLGREVLRAATAAVMADVTGLLSRLRGEPAPAVPYDPAAARRNRQNLDGGTDTAGDLAKPPDGGQPQNAAPA